MLVAKQALRRQGFVITSKSHLEIQHVKTIIRIPRMVYKHWHPVHLGTWRQVQDHVASHEHDCVEVGIAFSVHSYDQSPLVDVNKKRKPV